MADAGVNGATYLKISSETGVKTDTALMDPATARALIKALKLTKFQEGRPRTIHLPAGPGIHDGIRDRASFELTINVDFQERHAGSRTTFFITPEAVERIVGAVNKVQAKASEEAKAYKRFRDPGSSMASMMQEQPFSGKDRLR
jgi:hypothetical protein